MDSAQLSTDYPEDAIKVLMQAEPITSRVALAKVALHAALGAQGKKLLGSGVPYTVIIEVPSEQWISQIKKAAGVLAHGKAKFIKLPDRAKDQAEVDGDTSESIAKGDRVIFIACDDKPAPVFLRNVATHTFRVVIPDNKTVAAAMDLCLSGRLSSGFEKIDLSTLDYDTICASMPSGAPKKVAVSRLLMAGQRTRKPVVAGAFRLPSLEDAIEYGDAREWGLNLKADIADVRAGKLGWGMVDRGAVLHGEPGTGKTTFAKILAKACGISLVVKSTGELFASSDGYLDGVIKAQRRMFEEARASAPCLLFVDEISAIPDPATMSARGRDWWMPVIMDFQLQLDSAVSSRDGIILMGATNRIEDVSPALMRPGRLERGIYIGPPTINGLQNILRTHLGSDLAGTSLVELARAAEGGTAAEVMDWVRSGRRRARQENRSITLDDIMKQIHPVDVLPESERRLIAIHEAGHVVAGMMLGHELVSVTTTARDGLGGLTRFNHHKTIHRKKDLEDLVVRTLAGRAAEIVVLGTASSGSGGGEGSDLANATGLLSAMRTSMGLTGELFWHGAEGSNPQIVRGNSRLQMAVESDLQRLQADAINMVETHRFLIEMLAEALLQRQFLSAKDVTDLFSKIRRRNASG